MQTGKNDGWASRKRKGHNDCQGGSISYMQCLGGEKKRRETKKNPTSCRGWEVYKTHSNNKSSKDSMIFAFTKNQIS